MEILAEEFTVAGHQVKVATQVATKVERDRDYEIVRVPILKSCVVARTSVVDSPGRS